MGLNVDIHTSCWCPLARRMTSLKGKIVGTRQADALLVVGCEASDCPVRKARGCLTERNCLPTGIQRT